MLPMVTSVLQFDILTKILVQYRIIWKLNDIRFIQTM